MVRLPLPVVMVGVLVALLAKGDPAPQTPAVLTLTDSMSLVLELENKEDKEMFALLGLFASKMLPLLLPESICQESRNSKFPEVLMCPLFHAVEEPLKIQMVWLVGLSWLG